MRRKQGGIVPGNLAEDREASRAGLKLAGDDLDERAFARAIGADQSRSGPAAMSKLTLFSPITMPYHRLNSRAWMTGFIRIADCGLRIADFGHETRA